MRRTVWLSSFFCGLMLGLVACRRAPAQPSQAALQAFDREAAAVEAGLLRRPRLSSGADLRVEQVAVEAQPAAALLHHWRGTAFAPAATAAQFEQVLRDFDAYPRRFAPEVIAAHVRPVGADRLEAHLRVRQKHVLTVVLDADYDVSFARRDAREGSSASRSTRIYELDARGQPLPEAQAHGFLWRMNTYWTYAERDGGLALEVESISLSRAIPAGLGWALRPYVESVPRESLEFTLRSAVKALEQR